MAMDGLRRGLNSVPIAGGVFSSIWGDPDQEAHAAAMEQAAKQYEQYRPLAADARFQAFNNMSAAFGPMQQLMAQMYGKGATTPFSAMVQQPKLMPTPEEQKTSERQQAQDAMNRSSKAMRGRFL
jgi:hypothetical protein